MKQTDVESYIVIKPLKIKYPAVVNIRTLNICKQVSQQLRYGDRLKISLKLLYPERF